MNENERLHELDSLRGLAAVGVIAWHYTNHFHASPFPSLMAPFYGHGLLLVDFFFVLSGFVLARTYWNGIRSRDLAANLRDRLARLYPLHFTMLCVVALLQWTLVHYFDSAPFVYTFNDKWDFVLNLLLLNRTGLERGFSFNAPSWSISAEFVVNVAFLACISGRRKVSSILLAVGFCVALVAIWRNNLISNATFSGIDNDIFRAAFGFAIGVAVFKINKFIDNTHAPKLAYDAMTIMCIACFLYYCESANYSNIVDVTFTAACFPLLIISATRGEITSRVLKSTPLVFLGTISYSIYLVHFPLQLGVHLAGVAIGYEAPYASRAFFAALIVATLALSWLTYRFIEVPGKSAIRRLLGHRNPPATAQRS
ncbi:acyltransferase [Burkholderia multivorans]|nr:acyltransferase [Burkholderia multivorans]MDN7985619.1 acyltransferase [Burkholderia multivorans]